MESNNQSFWKFPNPSVWSVNNGFGSKRPEERRNFDIRVGGELLHNNNNKNSLPVTPKTPNPTTHNPTSDFNAFNYDWKIGLGLNSGAQNQCYSNNLNVGVKGYKLHNFQSNYSSGRVEGDHCLPNNFHGGKDGKNKKKKEGKKECNNIGNKDESNKKSVVDKRFKTLPPAEALPKNETIGGYIFVCNNDTMEDNLRRQLFGLPPRFRDSVRAITPGLPLFLYNYSTHQLHGIFEAASFGGSNIDSSAWEDKKHLGESRFPAQVRVQTRKIYEPLEEDEFRPILHHYDGPKFRLELSIPEVLSLLDLFEKGHPDV